MTEVLQYTYPSPLEGYENLPPLSNDLNEDGKSFKNPPNDQLSPAYSKFVDPITNGNRGGFDIHIYYQDRSEYETQFAKGLWERVRREFPELRTYKLWDRSIGPHTLAMFEVNVFTPAQLGAFIGWLVIHRGPLSALLHPNTDDEFRDHTQRATWLGTPYPLHLRMLKELLEKPGSNGTVNDVKLQQQ